MSERRADIDYHGPGRRYSRIIPLLSYETPPPESKFADLDSFDYQFNNVSVSRSLSLSSPFILVPVRRTTEYNHLSMQDLQSP